MRSTAVIVLTVCAVQEDARTLSVHPYANTQKFMNQLVGNVVKKVFQPCNYLALKTLQCPASSLAMHAEAGAGTPKREILLGTGSATRKEIVTSMGFNFEVIEADIDERAISDRNSDKNVDDLVLALASAKADTILERLTTKQKEQVLLTADQVVTCKGKVLEKPVNEREARDFVRGYSNASISIVGSCIMTDPSSGIRVQGIDTATFYFKPILEETINALIEGGDVFFSAGGLIVEHPLIRPYIERVDGTEESVRGLNAELVERLWVELQTKRAQAWPSADANVSLQPKSVDQFLDERANGWGRFQIELALKLCSNYAYLGADNLAGIFLVEALTRSDWDLGVSQEQSLKSIFYLGGIAGFLLSGPLGDTYGRRPTLLAFNSLRCALTLACFAAPSYEVLLGARVLSGAASAGAFNCIFPLLAEYAPPSQRARVKRDLGLSWQAGVLFLVGGAYMLRDAAWRSLALVFAPSALAALALLSIPESPRFLLSKGRDTEALKVLQQVALTNVGDFPMDVSLKQATSDGETTLVGIGTLFGSSKQSTTTLALIAVSFIASGTYYGLTFAPGSATGVANVFSAQLWSTLLEVPALLFIAPLANTIGRKKALSGLFALCAASLSALAVLSEVSGASWLPLLRLMVLTLGRCSGQAAGTLKWVIFAESFPTACRSTGLACCGVFGQLGGWLAPLAFGVIPQPLLTFSALLALLPFIITANVPENSGKELA